MRVIDKIGHYNRKKMDIANKTLILNINAIEENDTLTYDTTSIFKLFNILFSNLAGSLVIQHPNPTSIIYN